MNNATAPARPIAKTGTPLLSAAPVACTGLTIVLDNVGVTVGFGIEYEKDDLTVGLGETPVPVGRMMGRLYPPYPVAWIVETGVGAGGGATGCDGGIMGDTGVDAGGGMMGALGGMIGEMGVPDGVESGGRVGPVGPAGPSGCVSL